MSSEMAHILETRIPVASETYADEERLRDAVAGYAAQSRSDNTRRAYASDWQDFTGWCTSAGRPSLPAAPETLCLYMADRAETLKAASLRRRLSSISQAHSLAGVSSPTREASVRMVFDGIKRSRGTAPASKAPALAADVRRMIDALRVERKDSLLGLRDRALLLVGFTGGFRRSELTALLVDDLKFSARGLAITIQRSKTDQEGAGRQLAISPQPNPDYCPVRSVRSWLKASGLDAGPVFRAVSRYGVVSREALTPYVVALVVKRAAAAAGLDESAFAGHSLRSGFATSAAAAGASDRSIMKTTGHRSREMVDRYVKTGKLFDDNASSLIRI